MAACLLYNHREVHDLRRNAYVLLTVCILQLSGLRALCVPAPGQMRNCCPMCCNLPRSGAVSLPDCCVNSVLNFQGSLAEARIPGRPSDLASQAGMAALPMAISVATLSTPSPLLVLASTSPPRSPLSQSCLLLI